jgi:hypothetical protein
MKVSRGRAASRFLGIARLTLTHFYLKLLIYINVMMPLI